jgi:hypothetical protein
VNERYRNVVQVVVPCLGMLIAVCADGTLWLGMQEGQDYSWKQLNGPPLTIRGPAKPVVRPDVLVGPKRDLSTLPAEALVPADVPK